MRTLKLKRKIAVFTTLTMVLFSIGSCSKSSPSTTTTTTVGKSNLHQVISITFNQTTPAVSATVDNGGFWRVYTPIGTDLKHLVPTIVVSPGATVSPASGTAWDFTTNANGVLDFMVVAEDGVTGAQVGIQAF